VSRGSIPTSHRPTLRQSSGAVARG
jgi:hypothetical protein